MKRANSDKTILIVGITGASGAVFGVRLLEVLAETEGVETHLVVTEAGAKTIGFETDYTFERVQKLADFTYDIADIGATIASGSFHRDAMVVAPCTVKTLSAIANSYADNLLIRAADVTLKERKPLLLMVRETPLHLGHIRSMLQVTEMGAIVFPPCPSFYDMPRTIDDIVNRTVGRALKLLGIEQSLAKPWTGISQVPSTEE